MTSIQNQAAMGAKNHASTPVKCNTAGDGAFLAFMGQPDPNLPKSLPSKNDVGQQAEIDEASRTEVPINAVTQQPIADETHVKPTLPMPAAPLLDHEGSTYQKQTIASGPLPVGASANDALDHEAFPNLSQNLVAAPIHPNDAMLSQPASAPNEIQTDPELSQSGAKNLNRPPHQKEASEKMLSLGSAAVFTHLAQPTGTSAFQPFDQIPAALSQAPQQAVSTPLTSNEAGVTHAQFSPPVAQAATFPLPEPSLAIAGDETSSSTPQPELSKSTDLVPKESHAALELRAFSQQQLQDGTTLISDKVTSIATAQTSLLATTEPTIPRQHPAQPLVISDHPITDKSGMMLSSQKGEQSVPNPVATIATTIASNGVPSTQLIQKNNGGTSLAHTVLSTALAHSVQQDQLALMKQNAAHISPQPPEPQGMAFSQLSQPENTANRLILSEFSGAQSPAHIPDPETGLTVRDGPLSKHTNKIAYRDQDILAAATLSTVPRNQSSSKGGQAIMAYVGDAKKLDATAFNLTKSMEHSTPMESALPPPAPALTSLSVTQPASTTLLSPLPVSALIGQIKDHIQPGKSNPVELSLAPEELGKIRLVMTHEADKLRVVIHAERPETLEFLRRNTESFTAELRQSGYASTSFSFGSWGNTPQPSKLPEQESKSPAFTATQDAAIAKAHPTPRKSTGLDIRV